VRVEGVGMLGFGLILLESFVNGNIPVHLKGTALFPFGDFFRMAMRFISAADHTGHHRFEEVTGAVTPLRVRDTDVDAASLDASRVVPFAIAGTIHADTGDDDIS